MDDIIIPKQNFYRLNNVSDSTLDILFIDDVRSPQFDCIIARNISDAIEWLPKRQWDEVWFDFDLGGEETAVPILEFIEFMAFNDTPIHIERAILQTSNPVGRDILKIVLSRYYTVYSLWK